MTTRTEMRAKFPEVSAFVDRLRAAGFSIGQKFYAKEGQHEAGLNEMRDAWDRAIPVATVLEWERFTARGSGRRVSVGPKAAKPTESGGQQAALIEAAELADQ